MMDNIRAISSGMEQGTNSSSKNNNLSDGSFSELLKEKVLKNSNLTLSKHAANRVEERNIDMSDENIERLSEGVKIAEEKGLHAPLILIDRTAFIVNLNNRAVVTTVNGDDMKNNAFTNIDGTVIV